MLFKSTPPKKIAQKKKQHLSISRLKSTPPTGAPKATEIPAAAAPALTQSLNSAVYTALIEATRRFPQQQHLR